MAKARSLSPWWIVVLVAAAVLPRLPLVFADFTIDDPALLERAAEGGGIARAVVDPWPLGLFRPMVTMHFELCHRIFGSWAPGYHMVSIAIHALAVVLVLMLCRSVGGSVRASIAAALFFALLPSSTEAIGWASSVGDLWASVWLITAVLLAMTAADKKTRVGLWWWLASLLAVVLACSAKETAVVAALLVPAAAWLFARTRPAAGWAVANLAVVLAYVSWYSTRVAGPGVAVWMDSPWRCLVRTGQNLLMAVIPAGRNAVGDWLWSGPAGTRVVTMVVVLAVAAWVGLAAVRKDRITLFGWLWAVAAFLPVCPLPWGERYAYLPAVGLGLVAMGLAGVFQGRTGRAAAVVLLIFMGVCSLQAALKWTDGVGRFPSNDQNSSTAAAQWKPAPNAVSRTLSPGSMRP